MVVETYVARFYWRREGRSELLAEDVVTVNEMGEPADTLSFEGHLFHRHRAAEDGCVEYIADADHAPDSSSATIDAP